MSPAPPAKDSILIGALRLKCPPNFELLSTFNDPKNEIDALVRSSPDHTVYHLRPHIEFQRGQDSPCELVALRKSGELVFAMVVMAQTNCCFDTGFFGLLFPAAATEKVLKRAVAAMFEFFALNDHIRRFDAIQSILSTGAMDPRRRALLDYLLATLAPPDSHNLIFTRVLDLAPLPEAARLERRDGAGQLRADELDAQLLKSYEPDLRNQIRQAERNQLTVSYHLIATPAEHHIAAAYRAYDPMHAESWRRTNLRPHTTWYWHAIARAVAGGGGVDVVVVVRDGEQAVAGVTCHVYQDQAVYYSGGSVPLGLQKRGNPLALHAGISLCRRLGVRWFEIGRYEAHENEKLEAIRRYKSQFGGNVLRVANLAFRRKQLRPALLDEAYRLRYRMSSEYPKLWKVARYFQPLLHLGEKTTS